VFGWLVRGSCPFFFFFFFCLFCLFVCLAKVVVFSFVFPVDIVANSIEAVCYHNDIDPFYPKFIGASFANVSLSVLKDLYFTRAFGKTPAAGAPAPAPTTATGTPPSSSSSSSSMATNAKAAYKPPSAPTAAAPALKVPFRSYSLYTIRDSLTIFASFNLPSMIATYLTETHSLPLHQSKTIAQLVTPCAVQLASTPLHLLGMDYYNSPQSTNGQRWEFVKREYVGTTLARMGRIFPAYGIGGVCNTYLRERGKKWMVGRYGLDSA
jgi:hypothetical protein